MAPREKHAGDHKSRGVKGGQSPAWVLLADISPPRRQEHKERHKMLGVLCGFAVKAKFEGGLPKAGTGAILAEIEGEPAVRQCTD
jgi:hypothetical protein